MAWTAATTSVDPPLRPSMATHGTSLTVISSSFDSTAETNPTGMPMINAIGSSLLGVGTFGLATALNYARSGLVDWVIAGQFIAGGVVGGILGMLLATRLSAGKATLNRIFAVVVASVAVYVLYRSGRALLGYGA